MSDWPDDWGLEKTDVPEGVSGNWRVEKFSVSEEDVELHNMRCMFHAGEGHRTIDPGKYTRLMCGKTVVMSDTKAEIRDHIDPVRMAHGDVLINGLGLGIVAEAALRKEEVSSVTVIEISQDVIGLVAPPLLDHWTGVHLKIIYADALTWKPPKGIRYGAVWHDIWTYICADNLKEMKTLHRRYGRRCDWQGSWCRELCKMYA